MERQVQAKGKRLDLTYLFYTTCPRCAKHYGKNYVVGVSRVRSGD
jgi:NMD protein affecting ribosome stability and mRNA decay